MPFQGICSRCGYISSQALCKACILLEGLNRGLLKLGIGKVTAGNLSAHIKKLETHHGMAASGGGDNTPQTGSRCNCQRNGGKGCCREVDKVTDGEDNPDKTKQVVVF